MTLVRVIGTVLDLEKRADIIVDAGIYPLHWAEPGLKFAVEVEVIEREGDRVVVKVNGPWKDEDE